jgi:hypothetical protein
MPFTGVAGQWNLISKLEGRGMIFSLECPTCKQKLKVSYRDMAARPEKVKCCLCGDAPPPDIMTAYQNVGKTLTQLYGCCDCGEDKSAKWLPQEVEMEKIKHGD